MKLKTKILGLETGGKPIVVLNKEDADDLGVRSLSRIQIRRNSHELTCIVDVAKKLVPKGFIGLSDEVRTFFDLEEKVDIEIEVAKLPNSLQFIRNRLNGRRLNHDEMLSIVTDVVGGNLNEIEIASFVTSLHDFTLDMEEASNLSLAMVKTGGRLSLDKNIICDKHSIGGVAGDKTSMLVVPMIAAAGLTIPKTSSRAITGAAGTADRVECIMPVSLGIEEMTEVVNKTNGCLVWGGNLHLAPADDIFVQIEYPLSIDPLLLPSIMSKKKSVGATHLVIDIPTGRGTKIKTIGDANFLARDFIQLGDRMGIKVNCAITYGEQPIGHSIGPALEAKEVMEILASKKNSRDVTDKAVNVAGMLLEMAGKKDGKRIAMEMLTSGKAEKKLREIMAAQGGDGKLKPGDIPLGELTHDVISEKDGRVIWMNNAEFIEMARSAGAPRDKGAGIQIHKKINEPVKKGEKLYTIYAEKDRKMDRTIKLMDELDIMGVGERREMLIHKVEEIRLQRRTFILER